MADKVFTFTLNLDWFLVNLISQIDRFDASWSSIERKEGQSLKHLKSIATVRSVGASTRIEGSRMSDEEVEVLLNQIDITKLEDRDSQETTVAVAQLTIQFCGFHHLNLLLLREGFPS